MGAGAAGALNMWWDSDIDAVMGRTMGRPIPSGRVERDEALAVGLALAGFSVVMLGLFANPVAAGLLAFTIFFYVVVYSMWLKRATPQNIVIGGAAGRAAAGDRLGGGDGRRVGREPGDVRADLPLDAAALLGAGALPQRRLRPRRGADAAGDGRAAGDAQPHPRLCAGAGARRRWRRPSAAIGGPVYLAGALVLNAVFVAGAWRVWRRDEAAAKADRFRVERRFFGFSILYLTLHFALLLAEAALRALDLAPAGWPVLLLRGGDAAGQPRDLRPPAEPQPRPRADARRPS